MLAMPDSEKPNLFRVKGVFMTNMMILTSTLSIFHSFPATYPSGPSYGVYISQLIRYAGCCLHYDGFRYRHKSLVDCLLSQGYISLRLEKSFKKFYDRYQDKYENYRPSDKAMVIPRIIFI